MRLLDKGEVSVAVTVALAGLAFVVAKEWAVGWLLLALAGLLALRWMLEDPPRTRLSRGLRLVGNYPYDWNPLFDEGALLGENVQALRSYRYRDITLRTARPVHRLRFVCTGPLYYRTAKLSIPKWQEGLPPTEVHLSLPDENVVQATFLPAPFAPYHHLNVRLGSTADFRVVRIQVLRFSLKREQAKVQAGKAD